VAEQCIEIEDWRFHERASLFVDWSPRSRRPLHLDFSPVSPEPAHVEYQPRTELGRKLLAIRKKIVASGAPLLSWEEISEEVGRRRRQIE
jgi:hypothetical protein